MFFIDFKRIYSKYVAVPSIEDTVHYTDNKEFVDVKYVQWLICDKNCYDKNGYADEQLPVDIPLFGEDMENCYSYQPDYPNADVKMQSKILKHLGFDVRNMGD